MHRANPFVGRAEELQKLAALLRGPHGIVTLWGPPGTGKTRLALQWMTLHGEAWPRGVRFCDLSEVHGLEGLVDAVEACLDLAPIAGERQSDASARVGRALAARGRVVLVLDNFEQLVEHAATLGEWAFAAPHARLLVTSRERLHLSGEVTYEIPPLQPGEALALFVERVRARRPDFALTDDAATRAREIVQILEGVPLAVELAAARADTLGLEGLRARLPKQLDVLARGPRDAGSRHATWRRAVEWSWELLDAPERLALAQCTTFEGGFSLDAAEAIVRADGGARVLDVLAALRDKSLLQSHAPEGLPGEVRFTMLASVRELAAEHLGDAAAETDKRHAAFYLALGRRLAAALRGRDAEASFARLFLERDNLRRVLDRALAAGEIEAALSAIEALDPVFQARGPFGAWIELLDRAIARAESTLPVTMGPRAAPSPGALRAPEAPLLLHAVRARARARQMCGRVAESVADLERALFDSRAHGLTELEGALLFDLGVTHHQARDMDAARGFYTQALAVHRRLADRRAEGRALGDLGAIHHDLGELDAARSSYEAALALLREAGDARLEAVFLQNLGVLEQERGELDAADEHLARVLDVLRRAGDRRVEAIAWSNRGTLRHERGDHEAARADHAAALAILREVGDQRSEALCRARLAGVLAAMGRIDPATAELDAAERLAEQVGDGTARDTVRLNRAFIDAAGALRAHLAGSAEDAAAHVAAARARVASARAGSPSLCDTSDDARASVRILDRALAPFSAASPPRDALLVGPGARWLRAPLGAAQDLWKRRTLRLILVALLEARFAAPERGVSLEALGEAGWPGERAAAATVANRVHVALTALRKLGLKSFLESREDGYRLDPALSVTFSLDAGGPPKRASVRASA